MPLSLILWLSRSASAKPPVTWKKTLMNVHQIVRKNNCQKLTSERGEEVKTLTKCLRPTNGSAPVRLHCMIVVSFRSWKDRYTSKQRG